MSELRPGSIALADYSFFGKVRVTGKDRAAVLHNVLTQDIKHLSPDRHAPAALLSNTGKILMLMEVFALPDSFILVVEKDLAQKTLALIDRYVITEDVKLEEATQDYAFFQSFGMTFEKFLIPKDQTQPAIKGLYSQGFEPVNDVAAEMLRIEAGILRYGSDMDEETVLPETGLEKSVVSTTKGCYPGQEVVARIETYGGLHRKICGFIFEGSALTKPGSKVYADAVKEIGWITSAAFSKNLGQGVALGYLKKGHFEKNLEVAIRSEETWIEAKTTRLPFPLRQS